MSKQDKTPWTPDAPPAVVCNYRLVHAAKKDVGGGMVPMDVLDRIVAPVDCRRTRDRLANKPAPPRPGANPRNRR
jgi:hypothetical protein